MDDDDDDDNGNNNDGDDSEKNMVKWRTKPKVKEACLLLSPVFLGLVISEHCKQKPAWH